MDDFTTTVTIETRTESTIDGTILTEEQAHLINILMFSLARSGINSAIIVERPGDGREITSTGISTAGKAMMILDELENDPELADMLYSFVLENALRQISEDRCAKA